METSAVRKLDPAFGAAAQALEVEALPESDRRQTERVINTELGMGKESIDISGLVRGSKKAVYSQSGKKKHDRFAQCCAARPSSHRRITHHLPEPESESGSEPESATV